MIRVICLNPAVDRTYHIDNFQHGRQYHGNIPQISAGGKGINVARVIRGLDEPVEIRGFIGGSNGEIIRQGMAECGCLSEWTTVSAETRFTINIVDNEARKESELIEAGHTPQSHLVEQFLQKLENDISANDIIICSGIGFPGMRNDIYRKISEICYTKKALCFLDTMGVLLESSLGGTYAFSKPNKNELLSLYKSSDDGDTKQIQILAGRMRDTGVDTVVVSLGSKGALFFNQIGTWYAEVPNVTVHHTIGCGDSVVAGYAAAVSRGLPPLEALRLSMACGVANAMGPELCKFEKERVDNLLDKVVITNLDEGVIV